MPFDQRPTATTAAVLAFFAVSIVGAFCKNSPFTCCKRALIAMLAAYLFANIVVKIINAVVVHAMISRQVNKTLQRTKGKGKGDGSTH